MIDETLFVGNELVFKSCETSRIYQEPTLPWPPTGSPFLCSRDFQLEATGDLVIKAGSSPTAYDPKEIARFCLFQPPIDHDPTGMCKLFGALEWQGQVPGADGWEWKPQARAMHVREDFPYMGSGDAADVEEHERNLGKWAIAALWERFAPDGTKMYSPEGGIVRLGHESVEVSGIFWVDHDPIHITRGYPIVWRSWSKPAKDPSAIETANSDDAIHEAEILADGTTGDLRLRRRGAQSNPTDMLVLGRFCPASASAADAALFTLSTQDLLLGRYRRLWFDGGWDDVSFSRSVAMWAIAEPAPTDPAKELRIGWVGHLKPPSADYEKDYDKEDQPLVLGHKSYDISVDSPGGVQSGKKYKTFFQRLFLKLETAPGFVPNTFESNEAGRVRIYYDGKYNLQFHDGFKWYSVDLS